MAVMRPAYRDTHHVCDLGALTTVHRVGLWATAAWTGAGVVLWLCFPMLAPTLMLLSLVVPLAWYWAVERRVTLFRPTPVMVVLVLANVYLLANALTSPGRATALDTVIYLALMLGALHTVSHTLMRLDQRVLVAVANGFFAGLAVGGVYIAIELFDDQLLRRLMMGYLPFLRPEPQEIWGPDMLAPYLINKSISVLTLLLCPAALLARQLRLRDRHRLGLLAILALVTLLVFSSEHDSSKVALTAGIAVFGLARLNPAATRMLIIACWMFVNLCVVPAALLLYGADLQRAPWLPDSWRHRIVIWQFTAEQVTRAPILGAGMDSARTIALHREMTPPPAPGTPYGLSTSWHSHNGYLQIWYEAGAVGVLLSVAFGLLVLSRIGQAPIEAQPYFLAQFTAAAAIEAFSFSIWACWFMASIALSSVFCTLATGIPVAPRLYRQAWRPTMASVASAAAAAILVAQALPLLALPYRVTLQPPLMAPDRGTVYRVKVLALAGLIQPVSRKRASPAQRANMALLENGTAIGGPDEYHLTDSDFYFSASDGTDPRANGRRYEVIVPMHLSQRPAWAAGALAGLAVLVWWQSLLARIQASAFGRMRFRPSRAAALGSGAFGIAVAAGLQTIVVSEPIRIQAAAVAANGGFAYTTPIASPSRLLRILADPAHPPRLIESGTSLGPVVSQHQEIRDKGEGRYAFTGQDLYFSASDGSDPRNNRRRYKFIVALGLSPLVAWPGGGLAGLILLVAWGLLNGLRTGGCGKR